ncbi:MAG TPA: hypothetical protein VMA53_01170 [Stellaceae bacterium]|nr:hypothetical protein [Stellaceae bacterium]
MRFIASTFAPTDDRTARYIEGRIADATIIGRPYPYIYVREIFPAALYQAMTRDLPEPEAWENSGVAEPHFDIIGGNTSDGLETAAQMWRERYSGYIDLLNRLLAAKFSSQIDAVFGRYGKLGLINGTPEIFTGQSLFCQRPSGWQITPHAHNIAEVLQSLIYFPLTGSDTGLGTRLFETSLRAELSRIDIQHKDGSFARERVWFFESVPYEPNALFTFLNSPIAVHSAEDTAHEPPRRYIFTKAMFSLGALAEGERERFVAADFFPRHKAISRLIQKVFS